MIECIMKDDLYYEQRVEANILFNYLQTFIFSFNLYLMENVLRITYELTRALLRNDQDIVNLLKLVELSKQHLQLMRDYGWNSIFYKFLYLCKRQLLLILISHRDRGEKLKA